LVSVVQITCKTMVHNLPSRIPHGGVALQKGYPARRTWPANPSATSIETSGRCVQQVAPAGLMS
jgi:hypothetical protein